MDRNGDSGRRLGPEMPYQLVGDSSHGFSITGGPVIYRYSADLGEHVKNASRRQITAMIEVYACPHKVSHLALPSMLCETEASVIIICKPLDLGGNVRATMAMAMNARHVFCRTQARSFGINCAMWALV